MRYKFTKTDFWEELKAVIGNIPCNVIDTGDELLLDFGAVTLTPAQEAALIKLLSERTLLRGRTAKFVARGIDITLGT